MPKKPKITLQHEELANMLRLAYCAGFRASGEGWNGEHPGREKTEGDSEWQELQARAVGSIFPRLK